MRRVPLLTLLASTLLLSACDHGADTTSTTSSSSSASSSATSSSSSSGVGGGTCGDGTTDPGEACDDGNTVTEACAYGEPMCDVCDDHCELVAGATHTCGDGEVDAPNEACDDGNAATDACAYGQASCTVCDDQCQEVAGATSTCGDGAVDPSHEACDDGNAVTEDCTYGDANCTVCDATCHDGPGIPHVCGDGVSDATEACDDGNTVTEVCAYGLASCTVCDGTCELVAGATSLCGDSAVDPGTEDCDDGNATTETCAYGLTSCTVCDGSCHTSAGAISVCGDGVTDGANGEDCDDGNVVTESCAYGQAACTVCDGSCKLVSGATSYCGDGTVDAANGEDCEDGNGAAADGCEANCTFACGHGSGGTKAFQTTLGCFVRFDALVTSHAAAAAKCASIGMELPELHGAASNAVLKGILSNQNVWLGLGDATTESTYTWESGAPVDYVNWFTGEPNNQGNEDCSEFYWDSGKWNDTTCGATRRVVCMSSTCGDGTVDANEACDDGNQTLESCAYGATSCGAVCGDACASATANTTYCGDSKIDAANGEGCDDGNANATDGCASCAVSSGYSCFGAPSQCVLGATYAAGPGLGLGVADNGYNGTLASMSCVTLAVPSAGDGLVDHVAVRVGMQMTWIGDLTIKVVSPSNTVVTVLSMPGVTEGADNGAASSGEDSDLSPANPVLFLDGASVSAESMGNTIGSGAIVCANDGICTFNPSKGAATGGPLSSFDGGAGAGNWQVCVGDSVGGDVATIDAVQLFVAQ